MEISIDGLSLVSLANDHSCNYYRLTVSCSESNSLTQSPSSSNLTNPPCFRSSDDSLSYHQWPWESYPTWCLM